MDCIEVGDGSIQHCSESFLRQALPGLQQIGERGSDRQLDSVPGGTVVFLIVCNASRVIQLAQNPGQAEKFCQALLVVRIELGIAKQQRSVIGISDSKLEREVFLHNGCAVIGKIGVSAIRGHEHS